MNKDFYELHSEICQTLAHPIRLEILDSLRHGPLPVGELAERCGVSVPNMSQHLALLRSRGVVLVDKQGQSRVYRLSNPKIVRAFDIISEVMDEQLAARVDSVSAASRHYRRK